MVTIIITIKLFHLFISALCAAVFLDSVNLTETFPVSPSLFELLLPVLSFLSASITSNEIQVHRHSSCGRPTPGLIR